MIRQTREAMVKAIGVKMQAKRPAFPMMAVAGGCRAKVESGKRVVLFGCSDYSSFE